MGVRGRRPIGNVYQNGELCAGWHSSLHRRDAAVSSANLPLVRMEPILRTLATERDPGRVLFGHGVTELVDDGESVLVTVKDSDDKQSVYRSKYVVGADGGRLVGPKIGVVMEGPTNITDLVSVHFGADLSQ